MEIPFLAKFLLGTNFVYSTMWIPRSVLGDNNMSPAYLEVPL